MLERLSELLGKAAAWMTLLMVIVMFIVVVMRYVFDAGLIWLQESVVWMHAFVFMVGAAYTLQQEEHVRVDIFYRETSPLRRAWIDLIGIVVFLLPICAFLIWKSYYYVAASWGVQEASREAGGLPYPFIPLLKTILIIMPITVGLQGVAILQKCIRTIRAR